MGAYILHHLLQKLRGRCRRGYGTRVRGRGSEHGNSVSSVKYELTVVVIEWTRHNQA